MSPVNLESYRRGFHVGDEVIVEFAKPYTTGGKCQRVGTIARWSWHGRNYSPHDALPNLRLVATVEIEKRDGSGSYYREFRVEDLRRADGGAR